MTVSHGALGADGTLVVADIHFVAQDDEGEGLGVARGGLDEELVPPRIKGLEGFGRVNVVHQHAAVSASIEGYAEGLKSFLAGCVPEL